MMENEKFPKIDDEQEKPKKVDEILDRKVE